MKHTPLISVILTSYNSEQYIAQAIKSIIQQTYTNWELLIADDCSTDSTREIIETFVDDRIKIYHNEENIHYLKTRNKLIDKASGDLISFQDSDDISLPNRFDLLIKEFKSDPELGMCGSFVTYINEREKVLSIKDRRPTKYTDIKQEIQLYNVYTGPTIIVKKEIWLSIGGYRDYFSRLGYEDYDLTSRIVEKHKSTIVPKKLYKYRQHSDSTSKKDLMYNPFKYHGHFLVRKFIEERRAKGIDSLQENNISGIIHFILERNKPYVDDPSLLSRDLMWSSLKRENYTTAFNCILQGIQKSPLNYKNYKSLLLFFLVRVKILRA